MTAPRVVLDLADDERPDGDWLLELLAWDLGHLWGPIAQDRCRALVLTVAARHAAVQTEGPRAWPTLDDLENILGTRYTTPSITHLLTVAVAAGWLVYEDAR